ncbi:MAG: AAA family ATPase [Geminicoccaceae bacterium]|nr:AAA family ATPase [Geminicoccaceae bacterium]
MTGPATAVVEQVIREHRDRQRSSGALSPPGSDEGRAGQPADAVAPRPLQWVWADAIQLDLSRTELVADLLPRTGLAVAYGESGGGKTFFCLDLAARVAAGLEWHGRPVERGVVLYVAAEAPASVERRLVAWCVRHGVEHLPLAVIQSSVDFLAGDAVAVCAVAEAIEAEHGRVALVVVDTLARAMTGNENLPDDMGSFVAACGLIRGRLDTCVLIVHHSGKDQARGARGHSSLRASTDVEIEVAGSEGARAATVTKSRDGVTGGVSGFSLEVVELGEDARGRTVSTCVAMPCEAPAKGRQRQRIGKDAKLARTGLAAALASCGDRPPASDATRGIVCAVTVEQWRQYFMQAYGRAGDDADSAAARQAWKRGREALLASGEAVAWGSYVWLANP